MTHWTPARQHINLFRRTKCRVFLKEWIWVYNYRRVCSVGNEHTLRLTWDDDNEGGTNPLITMSRSKTPSESRPRATWVTRRISPVVKNGEITSESPQLEGSVWVNAALCWFIPEPQHFYKEVGFDFGECLCISATVDGRKAVHGPLSPVPNSSWESCLNWPWVKE